MTTFKDAQGREWSLNMTLADVLELNKVGLDLDKARKDNDVIDMLADPNMSLRVS